MPTRRLATSMSCNTGDSLCTCIVRQLPLHQTSHSTLKRCSTHCLADDQPPWRPPPPFFPLVHSPRGGCPVHQTDLLLLPSSHAPPSSSFLPPSSTLQSLSKLPQPRSGSKLLAPTALSPRSTPRREGGGVFVVLCSVPDAAAERAQQQASDPPVSQQDLPHPQRPPNSRASAPERTIRG